MAKTRKKDSGETARAFAESPKTATPPAVHPEPALSAPFEGPPTQQPEPRAAAESDEKWAPQASKATAATVDDRDRIAARAYELYQERGGAAGDAMEDWLAAEREFADGREDDDPRD